MASRFTLTVNGRRRSIQADPDVPLLYVLRNDFELNSPKFGCGLSQCGACSVLVGGAELRSCATPAARVAGKPIWTIEGLPDLWARQRKLKQAALHPVQQAWIDEQVPQCGYCQSGMMIQAVDLLAKNPSPTDAQIRTAMDGHLCRCSTYAGIVRAVKRAAKAMA